MGGWREKTKVESSRWIDEETMRNKHSHWERKWNLVVRNGTGGIEREILGKATNRGEGGERERKKMEGGV